MRQRNQRSLAIFALSIALVATTVAYAVLQTSLNISASVTRKGGSWDIAITEIGQYRRSDGTYNPTDSIPMGNATTPSEDEDFTGDIRGTNATFNVTLDPGKSKTFYVRIKNNGTLNATMASINLCFKGGNGAITTATEYVWREAKVQSSDGFLVLKVEEMAAGYLYGGETTTLVFTVTYETNNAAPSEEGGAWEFTEKEEELNISVVYAQA